MSEGVKPVLKKPPGYRDPSCPPLKSPPSRRPILPTSYSYSPEKKRGRSRWSCGCCCATCLILLIMILLIVVSGSVLYLLFEPRIPVFHLQSVEFPRFHVTNSLDGPVLDFQAVVKIEVRNPNVVLRVNYGKTDVAFTGDADMDLGKGWLPGFSQEKKNTTVLKPITKVKGMLLDSRSVKKVRDRFRSKNLKMGTEVNTEVGVGYKSWNTFKLPIKAECDGVSLKDIDEGTYVPKCKITLFKLFDIMI